MTAEAQSGQWLAALLRPAPARIAWDRVVLAAIGIAGPVALGLVLAPHDADAVGAGALASMGALVATAMDVGSVGRERIHRMALASAAGALGFALGTLVYGHHALTFVAVIAATFVSGLSSAVSATASKSAVYFLMFAVTAANADFGLSSPWTAPLVFFLGAVWRLMLTVVVAAVQGRDFAPERRAVAGVYAAIAAQLAAPADPRTATALTASLDAAYEAVPASRSPVAARDARWQALASLLDASSAVVDAAIAAAEAGRAADPRVLDFLRALTDWIGDPTRPVPRAPAVDAAHPEGVALGEALADVGRVARTIAAEDERRRRAAAVSGFRPPSVAERLRHAARELATGRELWGAVLRLVLCMAVAQGLSIVWQLDRPYLVMLTIAQVMKPDFGSVFARAVQRGAGTLVGVAIGSLAVVLVPRDGWQVLVILVLAAGIPILMPRNYALYSVVTTPLAVLLVELHAGASGALVGARMLDTLLGCAIVVVLGYLPWPSTWHAPRHLASRVASLIRAISAYAAGALGGPAADSSPGGGAAAVVTRREAYRDVSDLRTLVTRSLAEPPAVSGPAAAWRRPLDALERVVDAVTAAATTAQATGIRIEPAETAAVTSTLDALADAVQRHAEPPPTPRRGTPATPRRGTPPNPRRGSASNPRRGSASSPPSTEVPSLEGSTSALADGGPLADVAAAIEMARSAIATRLDGTGVRRD